MDARNSEPPRSDLRSVVGGAPPIDFQRVISSFRRHIALFLIVALTVTALVAYKTMRSAPRYTATATVLINQRAPDILRLNTLTPQDAATQGAGTDSSAVDTEVEILRSRSLASRVVDQFHLDADPEFNSALYPPGRLASFIAMLKGGAPNNPALAKQREHEAVVNAVLGDLSVKRVGLTYTIELAVTSFEPAKAAMIANAFAQRYLTEDLDSKFEESHAATTWLDTRLAQLRQTVEAADTAVQQYKIANNLLSAEGATLTEQEISNIDTQLAQARAQGAEQDARLKTAQSQLRAGSNGGDVGEALANPVVQSLRAQHAQASAKLADLQARYGDKHPDVITAKRALADIDAQIQIEIQRVISSLKAQSEVAHTRTASLAATEDQSRGSLAGNNRAMVRLQALQRDDDAARAIYDGFLTRYKEVTAKEGTQQSDARVVSQAELPVKPSAPNKKLDFFLALVMGGIAGVAAVLLAELLDRGISGPEDIESRFNLPALGDIPILASTLDRSMARRKLDPVAYVAEKPLSRFAESFRNLRTSLLTSRTGVAVKVVAITSSLPGEGKTTTSLCLARTMALAGANVLLIDCDLRQRSINRNLKIEPTVGLLEVLNGSATLADALVQDEATGAMILPLAKSAFTPRDVFGSAAMARLLQELRQHFDVILLDTAPVLAVADTRILCPQADAVLFLTRWRKTSNKAVQSALRSLAMDDIYIAGITLTQVDVRAQARAGEGASHYYRAYRKYYSD